ncbi:hypothetical protein PIB30_050617 [Stylosanthes scabra]|uniref:Uncharacterized protein n=1 Tax=Stylosanthes scabra TaxID=79078 RepID=A0ABU6ZGG0_9FABA|nr:hypothetical protein [Stylosanthes scabra]
MDNEIQINQKLSLKQISNFPSSSYSPSICLCGYQEPSQKSSSDIAHRREQRCRKQEQFFIVYEEIDKVVLQLFFQMAKKRSADVFSSKADEDIMFDSRTSKEEEEDDAIENLGDSIARGIFNTVML